MRLDKMLADLGYGTRSEIKDACHDGRITVNGEVAKNPGMKIKELEDVVTVDLEPVVYTYFEYYMLNKPKGYVSATKDSGPTVMDLIHETRKGLFPCGRLDKDTEGLLLITNDGKLSHRLLSPSHHVDKEYLVHTALPITDEQVDAIQAGITIDGGEVCRAAVISKRKEKSCHLIITEGKYHQVKRMFLAAGNEVVGLKRLKMKNLVLDETLAPGAYRALSQEEIDDLKEH